MEESKAATCTKEECKCLHEFGLVAVQNADGSVSQMNIEQAKAMKESLANVEV